MAPKPDPCRDWILGRSSMKPGNSGTTRLPLAILSLFRVVFSRITDSVLAEQVGYDAVLITNKVDMKA